MTEQFRFSLNEDEKSYLKQLAKLAILRQLKPENGEELPEPPTDRLREQFGAFVTLRKNDSLRGCIGHIVGDKPLNQTIIEMARQAAFSDPRFPPVTLPEFEDLEVEISILSPLTQCPDPTEVAVGRHGLLVKKGFYSGLLLPQVPVEQGWDRDTFLSHTCMKAGLPGNCWKSPDTVLFWFEAEVF
jgi:AmmeMemoRadiSam system protein A